MNNNLKSTKTLNILSMIYLALYLIVFYFFRYMNESILSLLVQIVLLGLIVIKRNKYAQWIFHINSLPIFLDLIGIKDSVSNTFNIIAMISLVCMIVILNIYLIKTGDSCKFLKSRWNDKQKWFWYFDISMIILITTRFISSGLKNMVESPLTILTIFILLIIFKVNRIIRIVYYFNVVIVIWGNINLIIRMLEKYNGEYEAVFLIILWVIQIALSIISSLMLIRYKHVMSKQPKIIEKKWKVAKQK